MLGNKRIGNKCHLGHDLTGANLHTTTKGIKVCKKCRNAASARYRQSKKGNVVFLRRDLKALGWTVEMFEAATIAQDGVCAICKRPPERSRLSADHDHDTIKARGLLCSNCNSGLGMFKDNSYLLELAAIYLRKYGK